MLEFGRFPARDAANRVFGASTPPQQGAHRSRQTCQQGVVNQLSEPARSQLTNGDEHEQDDDRSQRALVRSVVTRDRGLRLHDVVARVEVHARQVAEADRRDRVVATQPMGWSGSQLARNSKSARTRRGRSRTGCGSTCRHRMAVSGAADSAAAGARRTSRPVAPSTAEACTLQASDQKLARDWQHRTSSEELLKRGLHAPQIN